VPGEASFGNPISARPELVTRAKIADLDRKRSRDQNLEKFVLVAGTTFIWPPKMRDFEVVQKLANASSGAEREAFASSA
jgi:hypothetical protein